jgi:ankyrin repeat protein
MNRICLNCDTSGSKPGESGIECPVCGTQTKDQIIFSLVRGNDYQNLKLVLDIPGMHPNVVQDFCRVAAGTPMRGLWRLATPLHWAIANGYVDIIELLISKGARVTSLMQPYVDEYIDSFELVYESKEKHTWHKEFNQKYNLNAAPDPLFVEEYDVDKILSLLFSVFENGPLDKHDLFVLAKKGFVNQIRQVINNEHVDPLMKDAATVTVLGNAIDGQSLEVVKFLLEEWYDSPSSSVKDYIITAVANERKDSNHQIFDLILEKTGSDSKVETNPMYYTSMHYAVNTNNEYVVKRLVETGSDINEVALDFFWRQTKQTPLHHAIMYDRTAMVQLLLSLGSDINITDDQGATPLHRAIMNRNVPMVEMLIDAGSDVYAVDEEGKTLLHYLSIPSPYFSETLSYLNVNESERELKEEISHILRDKKSNRHDLYWHLISEGHIDSMSKIIDLITGSLSEAAKRDYFHVLDYGIRNGGRKYSAFGYAAHFYQNILSVLALKKAGAWDEEISPVEEWDDYDSPKEMERLVELELTGPWAFG